MSPPHLPLLACAHKTLDPLKFYQGKRANQMKTSAIEFDKTILQVAEKV